MGSTCLPTLRISIDRGPRCTPGSQRPVGRCGRSRASIALTPRTSQSIRRARSVDRRRLVLLSPRPWRRECAGPRPPTSRRCWQQVAGPRSRRLGAIRRQYGEPTASPHLPGSLRGPRRRFKAAGPAPGPTTGSPSHPMRPMTPRPIRPWPATSRIVRPAQRSSQRCGGPSFRVTRML